MSLDSLRHVVFANLVRFKRASWFDKTSAGTTARQLCICSPMPGVRDFESCEGMRVHASETLDFESFHASENLDFESFHA